MSYFLATDADKENELDAKAAATLQMSGHVIVDEDGNTNTLPAQDVLTGLHGEDPDEVPAIHTGDHTGAEFSERSLSDLRDDSENLSVADLKELLKDDRKGAQELAQKELDRRDETLHNNPVTDEVDEAIQEVQEEQQEGQNTPAGTEAVDELRRERGFLPDGDEEDKDED